MSYLDSQISLKSSKSNEYNKHEIIKRLKKSRGGYVSYLSKTINTIIELISSIENYSRVKNLEPQLGKALANINAKNQELFTYLPPEECKKEIDSFTTQQFRVIDLKKSLESYYEECKLNLFDNVHSTQYSASLPEKPILSQMQIVKSHTIHYPLN